MDPVALVKTDLRVLLCWTATYVVVDLMLGGAMRLHDRLWSPCALVFLSSTCIMVIEFVAGRLIAPRVGVSIHTWTAIIGVILAGISLGNYIGGRLADRRASPGLLGSILALASLSSLAILWLNNDLHEFELPVNLPFMVWVLVYVAGVFVLPSTLLGCISPIVVKLSLTNIQRTGSTVGRIYAWSSVGSIVGTFATGFWLIATLGTKATILLVSCLLMVLAVWFLTDGPWRHVLPRAGLVLGLLGTGTGLLHWGGFLQPECLLETNYYCIKVNETTIEGRTIHELLLDRLVHSYSDIDDPTYLVYGYERTYVGAIGQLVARNPDLDALFIGGGGYTFPRYLEATLPESHLVVVEIDPEVTQAAHRWLGLDADTRIETHNLDARNFLARWCPPESFDVIFGDAFNDYSVPYHLTTLEFARLVDRALRDDGLYVANIVDGGPHGHFFRAYVRTLQQAFRYVTVIPSVSDWREAVRTTFVVVASQRPHDLSNLLTDYVPLSEEGLRSYLELEPPLILTDDHAPVGNLMAPVVEGSFSALSLEPDIVDRIRVRVVAVATACGVGLLGFIGWQVYRLRRKKGHAMQ